MPLPTYYPPIPPSAIASYDYTDIAEGTGMKVFYGTYAKVTTTNHYMLLSNVVASDEIQKYWEGIAAKADFFKVGDLDFDASAFNLPKDVKGTAYVSLPFYAYEGSGVLEAYIIAKLRKWDGTTETEIASAQSETYVGDPRTKKLLLKMTAPLTHFKKGETLRMTIEVWYKATIPGNPSHLAIGHDPKGRTTAQFPGTGDYKVTTTMEVHIPFRIEL